MMRGEPKARWMLQQLADANMPFELAADPETGKTDIQCIPSDPMTEAQKDALYLAVLFASGWPGCYRTLIKIVQAEGLSVQREVA